MKSQGHLNFHQLWSQHNEHRIAVGRLLYLSDLFLFGGRNVSLLIEIAIVQVCHFALFLWIARKFGGVRGPALLTLCGFLAYCFFSPLQMQNFDWGFQVVFLMAGFAASLCFACALWYWRISGSSGAGGGLVLAGCMAAAFVSESSLANGLLVWPLLLLLAYLLRFSRLKLCIVLVFACLATAAYLNGYRTPGQHSNPLQTIREPFSVLKFVVTYFAFSWDRHLPNASNWPAISESITAVAIGAVLIRTVQFARNRLRFNAVTAFLLVEMLFCIGSATMTATGRMNFGYQGATESRYQSFALLFWACAATMLATHWDTSKIRQTIAVNSIVILLLVSTGARWKGVEDVAIGRQLALAQGWDALVHHQVTDSAIDRLYPAPSLVPGFYEYMRSRHWGPHGTVMSYARVEPSGSTARIQGFSESPSSCLGFIDSVQVTAPREFHVSGWSYLLKGSVPNRIALVLSNGSIVVFGNLGQYRPDVPKNISKVKSERTGWSAELDRVPDGVYHAFAIDSTTRSACLLANEIRIDRN